MLRRSVSIAPWSATLALGAVLFAPGVGAADTLVPFNASIASSCVLTLHTQGTMTISSDFQQMGTEQTGGVAAAMAIIATAPATVSFTAPTMDTKPAAYVTTPTVSLKYTSTAGANQSYTTGASQYSLNA